MNLRDSDGQPAAMFDSAKASVRAFVSSSAIDAAATSAFGPGVSGAAVEAAVQAFDRKGWPRLVLVDEDDLHGARAAYDRQHDTIYLSRDFAASASAAAVTAALIEEIGHAIDARVNKTDAPGDEGEIFAQFVLGQTPSASELAILKAENDHGTIVVNGKTIGVELAAPVVGTITLDGTLADWTAADQIDKSLSFSGYDIYATATGGSYVFALKAPGAIGATTTAWLNTDQNLNTGYKIWGFAGGAEYNINFDSTGTPRLYTGDAGQTLVSSATVSFGYSADRTVVEFAVPIAAIGAPGKINTLWDINNSTFLPTDFSATQYEVVNSPTAPPPAPDLPPRTDFTKKVGIVYSDTSANQYWDKMAYSQLFMDTQNQAAMAGVRYEILTESDLTNLAKLANFDALVFPGFTNVQASQVGAIESALKTAVQQYKIGLVAAGEFMTNDQTGAALPGDPYARMKTLLDLQPVGGGWPANVTVNAGDITHPMMQDYAASELIRSYAGVGWLAYAPVTLAGTSVLATQTVGGQTYDAVVATQTGGRNVHFSTDAVMGDNNLLWQAIDYAVNGSGVSAGLQLSRQASILASRTDMDQAQQILDVNPDGGATGIYDRLLPILQQWKTAYNFVGSYFIDIGNDPGQDQVTDWSVSGPYYKQLLAMGNELGSHSTTHPDNTNTLTAAQIQAEFQGSKQIIEQQMSQILGQPFTVDGAAVPGAAESLTTAQNLIQYYSYLSGGGSTVGAGYPGAIGYLTPALAAQNKVYLAPNIQSEFSLVEWKGLTAAQASAQWAAEVATLKSHAEVPVLVWPWHDYGAADWPTNPPADSPYTTAMFTDFIASAYNSGAEFVTLDDLAERINNFGDSGITTTVAGSTITANVTSANAGKFALDLDNLGTQKIANVSGWYAYDSDSVFLDRNGGTYTIRLGTTADDVTHITSLPMRAELISLTGNGTNLNFSLMGEGKVVIDLTALAGRQAVVTGATISSLIGDKLTIDVGSIGQHDVSVTLTTAPTIPPTNTAPVITSNGGGASAAISVAENTTAVTTARATDSDAGQTLVYSISGGADAARFSINAQSGALAFRTAPDFEAPADQGANNVYNLILAASDSAGASDTQAIAVTVTNIAGSTLTGNNSANTLTGAGEEDTINGRGGNDTLFGLGGNDTFFGGAGKDTIWGGDGKDTLLGQDGNDVLIGGAGADTLTGAAGADRFHYNAITEGRDTITDFTRGAAGDKLDIRDVLVGYAAGTSNINNFVRLTGSASTVVSVNADGAGTDFVALATLQNVAMTGSLLNELVANGNLVMS